MNMFLRIAILLVPVAVVVLARMNESLGENLVVLVAIAVIAAVILFLILQWRYRQDMHQGDGPDRS